MEDIRLLVELYVQILKGPTVWLEGILRSLKLDWIIFSNFCAIAVALFIAFKSDLFSYRQKKTKYKSMLIAFCREFVALFSRSTMYCKQAQPVEIEGGYKTTSSYSQLFEFSDTYMFSAFCAVCDDSKVIDAFIKLKSDYFQVVPHVKEVAKLSLDKSYAEENLPSRNEKLEEIKRKIPIAQRKIQAFFVGSQKEKYIEIMKNTEVVIDALSRNFINDPVAKKIEQEYYASKKELIEIVKGMNL